MEGWKNIGIFLTGFAAVITAVSSFIGYMNEVPTKETIPVVQKQTRPIQLMKVNDPDGWVNLRSLPSTNSSVLETLNNGDVIQMIERQGNWIKAKTQEGIIGYIYFDRVELVYNDHIIPIKE